MNNVDGEPRSLLGQETGRPTWLQKGGSQLHRAPPGGSRHGLPYLSLERGGPLERGVAAQLVTE